MELPAGLREHPFTYRITSGGEVRVVRDGRSIVTVRGAAARKLAAQLGSGDARDQQLLARATGNYKRGNERGGHGAMNDPGRFRGAEGDASDAEGMSDRAARVRVRLRWIIAVLSGACAAGAIAPALGLAAGLLAGWAVLALITSTWVLLEVWGMDAEATRAHATVEDPGRRVARIVATIGSVASLAAVLVVAVQAQRTSGPESYMLAGIAVLSVASSWLLIQVNYLLHYAKTYYQADASGIDFNQQEPPEYTDFAYFSLGLGMTYQVADTNVTSNAIRRIVIAQTLLGYLFGAGIIATVINLITNIG